MRTFNFKKGVYILNRDYLTDTKIDSYNYELYIGENKQDVKKQYNNRHCEKLRKNASENIIQDVTILRICQVLEKLKYMEKSHYFNTQDITVLNWLENEFKIILKESDQSEYKKKKEIKRRSEDATKSNN
jgi:hypothetical protein